MSATSQISAAPDDAVRASPGLRWSRAGGWTSVAETLAIEAPLAIEIAYERSGQEIRKVLAVTMRTPGADDELACGFLFAEGLIASAADIAALSAHDENARGERVRTQRVRLVRAPAEDLQRISRGLVTSAACGLCGRPSLEGLPLRAVAREPEAPALACEVIAALPEKLRRRQTAFSATGGSHGAALCDARGEVLLVREDVGRHNAVDKLVGAALQRGLARAGNILVLSGRASFELAQKAAAAGIAVIVAVGAPSSAAVTLANRAGITLVGFARDGRFNVYTHADRLAVEPTSGEASAADDHFHD
ncbi:MAG TPA: formate dehydrogenase accessory sulfurtransferase FdhD [Opitutus sp.]|nr:formate dehydrogenase accessory sulfurtransferase FdhD [Opitutus sp.]